MSTSLLSVYDWHMNCKHYITISAHFLKNPQRRKNKNAFLSFLRLHTFVAIICSFVGGRSLLGPGFDSISPHCARWAGTTNSFVTGIGAGCTMPATDGNPRIVNSLPAYAVLPSSTWYSQLQPLILEELVGLKLVLAGKTMFSSSLGRSSSAAAPQR